jgi:Protein of unknown function (DUF1579)
MKQCVGVAGRAVCLLVFVVYGCRLTAIASAEDAPPPLIQQMIGTWDVRQQMWPGADAQPIELPGAVAERVLVGNSILQEIMTAASKSSEAPFTRVAYFDYNPVSRQFEYFSLDTRAPQMMNERSRATGGQGHAAQAAALTLYGGRFVAPQWGPAQNVPFRYRIVIGALDRDQQTVRLYFTPQSGTNSNEFLAFEYVYRRRS